MTLAEQLHGLTPVDKMDYLIKLFEPLLDSAEGSENIEPRTVDEEIESIDLEELAREVGSTKKMLIQKIKEHGGRTYRFGRKGKTMIRKTQWLTVVQKIEEEPA